MNVIARLGRLPAARGGGRIVAVGRFDGVHRGHQRLLERQRELADQGRAEAIVALSESSGAALTSVRQRLARFEESGIDGVVLLGRRDPKGIGEIVERLEARVLVAAVAEPDAGCAVDQVEPLVVDGVTLTSAVVREAVTRGELERAARALGRLHAVEGRVVHGFHRGASLGIPTANLRVTEFALPPDGVYAVRARVRGRAIDGVANIGRNPTFGNRQRSVETHLFDVTEDLYGARLEVGFVGHLRGERKFPGVEALVAQIRADIAAARELLASRSDGV